MRPPRITTRRLMMLILLGALLLGAVQARQRRLRRLAREHYSRSFAMQHATVSEMWHTDANDQIIPEAEVERFVAEMQWHEILAEHYGRASEHPWWPLPYFEPAPFEP